MDSFFGLLFVAAAYFAPTLVAVFNRRASWDNRFGVFAVNLAFGWTVIGWLVAAALAQADYQTAARVREAKAKFYLREAERP